MPSLKMLMKRTGFLLALGLLAGSSMGQTLDLPKSVSDYYQSALQAYLGGDFDQAIYLDSKALQLDPKDKKAAALLNILISEKDTNNKTVIWIGGKPVVTENKPVIAPPQAPVTVFKERVFQAAPSNNRKLAELETRVQTVAFLMERDSFNQYRELNSAQVQTTKRLEEISLSLRGLGLGSKISNLLLLLALLTAALALWKSWKNGREIEKKRDSLSQSQPPEEQNRVLPIRRI